MVPRNRDVRKLKRQYKVRSMPKKRLPATVDGAVCEKVINGRGEIRWDIVVERVWKDIGGNQEEVMSAENFGRYKAELDEEIQTRERLELRNKVESEKHLRDIHGSKRRDRSENVFENVFERPNRLTKTLKPRFRVGDLDLPGRRQRYTSSREEEALL